jgi:hypothetical protein
VDAAKDTLVGWYTNNDGMISCAEYTKVCETKPEEYKSILDIPYKKQLKLKGG